MSTFLNGLRAIAGRAAMMTSRNVPRSAAASVGNGTRRDENTRSALLSWLTGTAVVGSTAAAHAGPDVTFAISEKLSLVPYSISMLVTNSIPVPAVRLCEDLAWDTLSTSPMLSEDDATRADVESTVDQLKGYASRNMMISPDYATVIVKKFAHWFSLHEVHLVLQSSPDARSAIDEGLLAIDTSVTSLQDMFEESQRLAQEGKQEESQRVSKVACDKADRMNDLVEEIWDRVQELQEEERNRIRKVLVAGGVLLGLSLATGAIQLSPEASPAVSAVMEVAHKMTGLASTVMFTCAVFDYFTSDAVPKYLAKVKEARKIRNLIRHKLENLVEDAILTL